MPATAPIGAIVTSAGAFIRGYNSYTTTIDPVTIPAEGQTFVVDVKDPRWIIIGQTVFIGESGSDGDAAAFIVKEINGSSITLLVPDRESFDISADYGTSERATGITWVDGRMIYQKTYVTTTAAGLIFGATPFVTVNLAIPDFDLMIELDAVIHDGTSWQIKVPYSDNQGWAAIAIGEEPPGTGVIWIWQNKWDTTNPLDTSPGVFGANLPCYITLRYVKNS